MKRISQRRLPGLAAAVIATAASFGIATVVAAQTTAPTTPVGPAQSAAGPHGGPGMPGESGDHGMRGGPGRHAWPMMRELARLKTSLRLDATQTAAWDKAAAQMKPPAGERDEMRTRHERLTAALDDPNFDPRRLAAEMERADTERRARTAMIRETWFAVYDGLNPVQRGQVREFLREKMTHRPMMRGPMAWRHHGEQGERGEHGGPERMPPPPAAPPAR